MSAQLELEMLGGRAERLLRRRRGSIDDLPWGSLAAAAISEADRATARLVWTDSAFREYASAASFAALSTALLEAGGPIDLVAMCSDFVVDEMTHVELAARLASELGGAAPYHVAMENVSPVASGESPIERAAELALLTCIGEVLSVPSIAGALRATDQPLVRAVLARIVRDERPHARLGWLVLDWAGERVDRVRLSGVARERIEAYAPLWQELECGEPDRELRSVAGWMSDQATRATLIATVENDLVRPFAARGIEV